jgi:type I restriction enzyme S subunit
MGEKELPEGWCYAVFKDIATYVIGGDWGKDPESILDEGFQHVLCIRGGEIKNWRKNRGKTASLRAIKLSSLKSRELILWDILLEISGGGPDQPVGRTVLIDETVLDFESNIPKVCTNFLRLIRISKELNRKYINYYLQYFYASGEVIKYQGGSNNLRNLKYKEYETINIPLPPLAEQNRIVEKLDKLFASIEIVKAKLDAIPEVLKNFRQAVLSQAVTGKLTKIKVQHVKLSELLEDVKYGTSKKSEYTINGVPIFRIPNIKNGEIDETDLKFSILEEKEFQQLKLKEGDILIIRSNGSPSLVGQCAIVRINHVNYSYAGYLIRLRVNEKLDSEYLNYVLRSNFLRNQIEEVSRSTNGINNINSDEIKNLIIPLTVIEEQNEIVSKMNILFAKANLIEKQYQVLKTQIDNLPQAILSKAFRGELVAQNPNDEPASDLLERIKETQSLNKKISKLTQVLA